MPETDKEKFLRELYEGYFKPKGFEGMHFAFVDEHGRQYYSWKEVADMPAIRLKEVERIMLWVDAGITEANLIRFADALDELHMTGILKAKGPKDISANVAKAVRLTGELRNRRERVIPRELFYELAAICSVRDDEDPRMFDTVVNEQKAAMMREAGRAGADFFTLLPPFKLLLGVSLTTEAGFLELLQGWSRQEQRLEAVLKTCSYVPPSGSMERSSIDSPTASPGKDPKGTTN